jgi:hypothetical protein
MRATCPDSLLNLESPSIRGVNANTRTAAMSDNFCESIDSRYMLLMANRLALEAEKTQQDDSTKANKCAVLLNFFRYDDSCLPKQDKALGTPSIHR